MWIRHIRIFVLLFHNQQRDLFHVAAETTTNDVGMRSARASTEIFYRALRRINKALSELFAQIDEKCRERWSEVVNTINFTPSSRLAWNTINNLTGGSRNTRCFYPISKKLNSITARKKSGVQTKDCESARPVAKEVSDLWRIPTPIGKSISGDFTLEKFTSALQQLKLGKAPGPDSIFPEIILHAGAALKSWLNKFLSSCMHHLKLPKIWRRAIVVAIPKPMKPLEDQRNYRLISLLCTNFTIL